MYCEVCGYESNETGPVCSRCSSVLPDQSGESDDATVGEQPIASEGACVPSNESEQSDQGSAPVISDAPVAGEGDWHSRDVAFGGSEAHASVPSQSAGLAGGLNARGMIALAALGIAILFALVAVLCVLVVKPPDAPSESQSARSASASVDGETSKDFDAEGTGDGSGDLMSESSAASAATAAQTPFETNTTTEQKARAVTYGGHHYLAIDDSMTWTEAEALCVEMGGHLATISDAEEQSVVADMVLDGDAHFYWIGLTSEESADSVQFVWVDGTALGYTNWDPGEPNNKAWTPEGENYVGMWPSRGTWNDFIDNGSRTDGACGLVCEWDC